MALSNARQRHFFVRRTSLTVTRRDVLKLSAAAALAVGLPARWRGAAYASDAPEHPKMRFGIIALTDCSSIVMAHELGLFKKHGIESTISKERRGPSSAIASRSVRTRPRTSCLAFRTRRPWAFKARR
jgi:hypothetical protein